MYAAHGVAHVWLVDPIAKTLEVHTLGEEGRWREVEVYRAVQVIALAGETEVTFELPGPDRGLGTSLGAPESRRWELRLQGRAGARVEATFPVPVYAPPVDGEPAAG